MINNNYLRKYNLRALMLLLVFIVAIVSVVMAKNDGDYQAEALEALGKMTETLEADDYEVRDTYFYALLDDGEVSVIEHQFYRGNEYSIIAAGDSRLLDVDLAVTNEEGQLMVLDEEEGNTSEVMFTPDSSGPYYIMVKNYDCAPHDNAYVILAFGYK